MSNIPKNMTAIEITEFGGPAGLALTELETPKPEHGEVLIKVAAAGVNRPDIMQRQGSYPPPPGAPATPGLEVAGEVVAVGAGGSELEIGDAVCALVSGGGYAEYCIAPAPQCLPFPKGFDAVSAAALPETYFTVWTNLFQRGGLQGGESVLIHGGSSGIGSTAIQLANKFGARVFATAGSAEKCNFCEDLGAEKGINYRRQGFEEIVNELTEGAGVDVILDMVGGDYLAKNLNCLAVEGRLVLIAVLHGPKVENFNMLPIMLKRLTFTGSTLRPRSVAQKAVIAGELREKAWPLLDNGSIKPIIHKIFSLGDAAAAHELMESSTHMGKIMLQI